ncbi:MAG TPA: four helix bundle protein [Longimicrobiaceae bacterium]|nr:four helix bundle protein [Longimicrobiaceae bacterium]
MGNFKSLLVWQKSHVLTLEVYRATRRFPDNERFGLTSQLRRAAASIPANIAEGCGRNGDAELARFCRIGLGSTNEVEYHLLLARDLEYLEVGEYRVLVTGVYEVKRMLSAFIEKVASG